MIKPEGGLEPLQLAVSDRNKGALQATSPTPPLLSFMSSGTSSHPHWKQQSGGRFRYTLMGTSVSTSVKWDPQHLPFQAVSCPGSRKCGSKKNPGFNSMARALCTGPPYLSGAEVSVGMSQAHLQKEVPHTWKMPVSTLFFLNHYYNRGSSLIYMLGDVGQCHLTCLVKSRSRVC